MKSMKYVVIASAIMLALAGCDKKERSAQTETKPNTTNETAGDLKVVERPALVCDTDELKDRVSHLVIDNVRQSALDTLKQTSNLATLEDGLKAKLSALTVEVDDLKVQGEACVAKVSVALSEADIASADKVLAKANTTLAEQAKQMGVSLEQGRLVGDLVYHIDGEALSIKASDNPVIELTSSGLASAVVWMAQQKSATTEKPQPTKPKVVPINQQPNVSVRPQQPTPPTVRTNTQVTSTPTPTPRQQPTTVVRQEPKPAEPKPTPRVDVKPTPAPTPKPEIKSEPKPEPKLEPSVSHAPVTDNTSEITIIESNDTY